MNYECKRIIAVYRASLIIKKKYISGIMYQILCHYNTSLMKEGKDMDQEVCHFESLPHVCHSLPLWRGSNPLERLKSETSSFLLLPRLHSLASSELPIAFLTFLQPQPLQNDRTWSECVLGKFPLKGNGFIGNDNTGNPFTMSPCFRVLLQIVPHYYDISGNHNTNDIIFNY